MVENDVGSLSNTNIEEEGRDSNQDSVLSHFQEVTGKTDVDECLKLLDEVNWNLELAVQNAFNPNPVIPDPPIRSVNSQSDHSSNEGLRQRTIASYAATPNNPNFIGPRLNTLSVPIINRNPPSTLEIIYSSVWGAFFWPLKTAIGILSTIIGYVLKFLFTGGPPTPRQAINNVEEYIAEFNSKYGSIHPRFYHGGYKEAVSHAKRHFRFLLLYLHDDANPSAVQFAEQVICTFVFKNLVEDNLLFWSCSTTKAEGRCVAETLNKAKAPFLALLCYKEGQMKMVYKSIGYTTVETIITQLTSAIVENEPHLARQRNRDIRVSESSSSQLIMQEQDAAYRESLLKDQERARKRKEEEDVKRKILEKEEAERKAKEDKLKSLEELRSKLKQTLKPETKADTLSILLKLPNGKRVSRKFSPHSTIKDIYEFALTCDDCPNFFTLISNFPKRVLPSTGDCYLKTCLEMDIENSTTLFVEENESDADSVVSEVEI